MWGSAWTVVVVLSEPILSRYRRFMGTFDQRDDTDARPAPSRAIAASNWWGLAPHDSEEQE